MFGRNDKRPDLDALTAAEKNDLLFDQKAVVADETAFEGEIKDSLRADMKRLKIFEIEGSRARTTMSPARIDYRPNVEKLTEFVLGKLNAVKLPKRFLKPVEVKETIRCVARKRAA